MLDLIAAEPRLEGTVVHTVGAKGYDGVALVLVAPPEPAPSAQSPDRPVDNWERAVRHL